MDARILRSRQDAANARIGRLPATSPAGSSELVRTVVESSYPTAASAFYAVNPVGVGGQESEGSAATFSIDSSRTFHALNLGTQVPPQGTKVIVHDCDGRWSFRYDG